MQLTVQKETASKLSEIPPADVRNLCSTVLSAARTFYKDPENQKAFEAWKAQRDLTKGN